MKRNIRQLLNAFNRAEYAFVSMLRANRLVLKTVDAIEAKRDEAARTEAADAPRAEETQ